MCTNKLEYENEHLLPEKGGVRINRVYKLLEILQYINFTKMELRSLTFCLVLIL